MVTLQNRPHPLIFKRHNTMDPCDTDTATPLDAWCSYALRLVHTVRSYVNATAMFLMQFCETVHLVRL